MKNRQILILGDGHGNLEPIVSSPKDSIIIHVGDVGFSQKASGWLKERHLIYLQRILDSKNIDLYLAYGNHDDQFYWREYKNPFSRIHFCDTGLHMIEGLSFFFICGAISIDRFRRVEGVSYWKNEGVDFKKVFAEITKVSQVDYVISHTAPSSFYPYGFNNILWAFQEDADLKEDLLEERNLMEEVKKRLFTKFNIKGWVRGHFHESNVEYIDGVKDILLNIDEIKELI